MRPATVFLPWFLVLASCSSPPKPPSVDETQKRPVNSQTAVELRVCKNDLHNTRLLATESGRLAESTAATLANMAARQQLLAAMQPPAVQPAQGNGLASAPASVRGNRVFAVRFDFGSSRVVIPPDIAAVLVEDARSAPLVLLRGRTDGSSEAPAESRVARERAAAVRDYLVAAGVDPTRIRSTWQPTGDHVADNDSSSGRGLNRRVEIELYRVLPEAVTALSAMTASTTAEH